MGSHLQISETSVGVIDGANVIIRQSWLNQLGLIVIAIILEVAITVFTALFSETLISIDSLSITVGALPCIPLFLLLVAAVRVYNERLVVTPEYLIHVTGRISWKEHSVRLEYPHIQEIETVQSILQRLLGLGDVAVIPVGGGSKTIVMRGLRHPREVKNLIRGFKPAAAA
jgi:hypothetical protein